MKHNAQNIKTRVGKQVSFFLGGNLFTLIVGLPLNIYIARVLGAENLGVFSLFEAGVALLSGFLGLGLAPALVKFIPEFKEKHEYSSINYLVYGGSLFLLVVGGFAWLLVVLTMPWLAQFWPPAGEYKLEVLLMGALLPLSLLNHFFQQGLRGLEEIRYMVLGSSVLQLSVKAVLAIVLLASGMGLLGYVISFLVSVAVGVSWMFIGLRRKLNLFPVQKQKITWERRIECYKYSKIMYAGSLIGVGSMHLDRFLLASFVGAGSVGVLNVAHQLHNFPAVFFRVLIAVVAPMFSAANARGDSLERENLYQLTTDWLFRAGFPLLLFLFLFASPLLNLFGEEFAQSGLVALRLLLLAQAVHITFGPVGIMLNMSGQEVSMLRITMVQTVFSVLSLVLLVPLWGLNGAAASFVLVTLFNKFTVLYLMHKKLETKWWNKRCLLWVGPILAALVAGAVLFFFLGEVVGVFALAASLITLYFVFHCVSLLQGLHEDDKAFLLYIRQKVVG